jgi:hypothetical protein
VVGGTGGCDYEDGGTGEIRTPDLMLRRHEINPISLVLARAYGRERELIRGLDSKKKSPPNSHENGGLIFWYDTRDDSANYL